jgi:leader peptidase (prepilin peptidase)/N-methyltransferase
MNGKNFRNVMRIYRVAVYSTFPVIFSMIRIVGTILAGLLGLAFGSFLNVCLSRWPEGESVVKPRSHCRNCGRTLAWWENLPLVNWIALRGRCRTCKAKISWRYPLVELAVGVLWAIPAWKFMPEFLNSGVPATILGWDLVAVVGMFTFYWLLVALAVLDAESLWLPDWITLPGIALGFLFAIAKATFDALSPFHDTVNRLEVIRYEIGRAALSSIEGILFAAALILLIRWTYWLVRRREGIGLGDAKLMAMLGAWLGLSGALLSFSIGILLGAAFALVVLTVPAARRESDTWLLSKLPLGTFICIGGIISALWGQPIIAAYLRRVGLS